MKRLFSCLLSISVLATFMITPFTVFAACVDTDRDGYYSEENPGDCATVPPFSKGQEEARCDQVTIDSSVTDYELVLAPEVESVAGKDVNPGRIEAPNSRIDYNCDGAPSGYIPEGRGGDTDLFGVVENIITLIGQAAVFISVAALIYGGIMFATAAGEEGKIQKAKKTIIGAVIGLIIGLIAWNIVGFVTSTFGG